MSVAFWMRASSVEREKVRGTYGVVAVEVESKRCMKIGPSVSTWRPGNRRWWMVGSVRARTAW